MQLSLGLTAEVLCLLNKIINQFLFEDWQSRYSFEFWGKWVVCWGLCLVCFNDIYSEGWCNCGRKYKSICYLTLLSMFSTQVGMSWWQTHFQSANIFLLLLPRGFLKSSSEGKKRKMSRPFPQMGESLETWGILFLLCLMSLRFQSGGEIIILEYFPLEPLFLEATVFENYHCCWPRHIPGCFESRCAPWLALGCLSLRAPWPLTVGDVICLIYVTGRIL